MSDKPKYESSADWMNAEAEPEKDGKFEYDGEKLGENYCDAAASEQDDDEEIPAAIDALIAAGDEGKDVVLGGILFTIKSRAKLSLHGLTVDDAMAIIAQKDHRQKGGSLIAYGDVGKQHGEVVLSTAVPAEHVGRAEFWVVTGYYRD